jgi:hypothetical protein
VMVKHMLDEVGWRTRRPVGTRRKYPVHLGKDKALGGRTAYPQKKTKERLVLDMPNDVESGTISYSLSKRQP